MIILDLFARGKIRNFIVPSPELEEPFYRTLLHFSADIGNADFGATILWAQIYQVSWTWCPSGTADDTLPGQYLTDSLRANYWGTKLTEDLYPLLIMGTARNKVRQVLLETYFSKIVQGWLQV